VNNLGSLIFLQDDKTKQQFLVDTSAGVSLLPHRSSAPPSSPGLSGADTKPILGLDFLSTHNLLIDPVARLLLDAKTLLPINNPAPPALLPSAPSPPQSEPYWLCSRP
jgi:hypothetical protein